MIVDKGPSSYSGCPAPPLFMKCLSVYASMVFYIVRLVDLFLKFHQNSTKFKN